MSASTDQDSDGDGVPDGFEVDDEDRQQTSGGGGPLITWGSLRPTVPQVLKDFAQYPAGFIIGVILNQLVGGIETVVTAFIRAGFILLEGSRTVDGETVPATGTTQGSLGIADIPRLAADVLGSVGRAGGEALLGALQGFFTTLEGAASAAGPGAPIIAAVIVGGLIIAGAYALSLLWTLALDTLNPL